jgi:hypothetical protein
VRAFLTLALTVCGFFAVEFAIFQSGAYSLVQRHDSSTGSVETLIRNEQKRTRNTPHQILTIGDSRMGFFPRYANEMQTGYEFGTIATPGATPRDWYYMFRGADPKANKYSAVVIAMEDYEDSETDEDHSVRAADLYYLIAQLRFSDIPYFSNSFSHDPALVWAARRGIILKGLVYKRDFQEFLIHPIGRAKMSAQARADSYNWYYNYVGPTQSVEGVSIDWANQTMEFPPSYSDAQKAIFRYRFLAPHPPDRGVHSAYLHQWLGKIYEHYRGSNTRVIFLHLPRGPFVRPDQPQFNPHSSVRELGAQPGVILMPEHIFDSLEQPGLFIDQMHLNGPGSAEFSRILAKEVTKTLNAL